MSRMSVPALQMVTIPLRVAQMIRGGCLPRNECKMRGADPELVMAITAFKAIIAAEEKRT